MEKLFGPFLPGVGEEFLGGCFFDDAAPIEHDHAVADFASELCVTVEGLFVMFGNKREGVRPAMLRKFPHRMLSSIKAS